MDSRAYPVIVRPVPPEDGVGFRADVPDLPGCTAGGATPSEAEEAARSAIDAWIAEATAAGRPVPPPSDRLGAVTE